jgi:hypothetical protein
MNPLRTRTPVRRLSLLVIGALALLTAVGPQAFAADARHHDQGTASSEHSGAGHSMPAPETAAELAFHDQMRKLWEDHVTWTRLAIVTFAAGTPGFDSTAARLLQNQVDIGDAIKPFYGDAAGDQLTALLHDHITIAVEVLQAAKSGDNDAFTDANTRWYDNANQIADFLAAANPRFWPDDVMRADMKVHLDQTLVEAADELQGNYAGSVMEYEAVHTHILAMADMLSAGIIGQFPGKFH